MKPIEPSQETFRRDRVGGQRRPTPAIVVTLGGLAVAASVAAMTLTAVHHNPDASIPSSAAVIRADPPSPPPPGATGNPDQQPRRVCTHWDPETDTTHDVPCNSPS
jgi:hypothetical protein